MPQTSPHHYVVYPQQGVTLIELLIGMLIMSILVTSGIPALNSMVERYSAEVAMNTLQNAMVYARSEAVVRRSNVVICPRSAANAITCYSGGLGSDESEADIWRQGLLVFVDRSDDESYTSIDSDDGDLLLKAFDALSGDAGFLITGDNVDGQLGFVLFNGRGMSNPITSSFLICAEGDSGTTTYAGRLVLNNGRLRQASRQEATDECDA